MKMTPMEYIDAKLEECKVLIQPEDEYVRMLNAFRRLLIQRDHYMEVATDNMDINYRKIKERNDLEIHEILDIDNTYYARVKK